MSDEETRAGANPAELPASFENTEALLNSLIAECREYVRVLGLQFDNPEMDSQSRWKFVGMVMDLVKTGAVVGDTVAKLRGGAASEIRQRIIVERSQTVGGGGRRKLKNE